MEKVIGIENLKDQFRRAKIMCGDLRGLKNRFELSEKFGIDPMQTYFYATASSEERAELTADCYGNDGQGNIHDYTMSGLVEQMKNETGEFEVNLVCLVWNKYRTDAKRKTVSTFLYSNK